MKISWPLELISTFNKDPALWSLVSPKRKIKSGHPSITLQFWTCQDSLAVTWLICRGSKLYPLLQTQILLSFHCRDDISNWNGGAVGHLSLAEVRIHSPETPDHHRSLPEDHNLLSAHNGLDGLWSNHDSGLPCSTKYSSSTKTCSWNYMYIFVARNGKFYKHNQFTACIMTLVQLMILDSINGMVR
jgi:hypothetical protein